jgi:hypothetical protein
MHAPIQTRAEPSIRPYMSFIRRFRRLVCFGTGSESESESPSPSLEEPDSLDRSDEGEEGEAWEYRLAGPGWIVGFCLLRSLGCCVSDNNRHQEVEQPTFPFSIPLIPLLSILFLLFLLLPLHFFCPSSISCFSGRIRKKTAFRVILTSEPVHTFEQILKLKGD